MVDLWNEIGELADQHDQAVRLDNLLVIPVWQGYQAIEDRGDQPAIILVEYAVTYQEAEEKGRDVICGESQ